MKKKIIGFGIVILFFTMVLPFSNPVLADDPQITDETGDAFGYIDVDSIWFFEKEDTPDYLYVTMKINEPSFTTFQQTFAVFWTFNGINYACSLHRGFAFKEWDQFRVGFAREKNNDKVEGEYYLDAGEITWKIPKSYIGDPEKGDILEKTWSNAFRRVGFIGRIGFTRHIIDKIILNVFGNNMWDYAPERGSYGGNYLIKY